MNWKSRVGNCKTGLNSLNYPKSNGESLNDFKQDGMIRVAFRNVTWL